MCVQEVNKLGAKRAIENLSRQYVHAKRGSSEMESVTRGLLRGGTSVPLQGSAQETQQVGEEPPSPWFASYVQRMLGKPGLLWMWL